MPFATYRTTTVRFVGRLIIPLDPALLPRTGLIKTVGSTEIQKSGVMARDDVLDMYSTAQRYYINHSRVLY